MHPDRDALLPLNALEDNAYIRQRFAVPKDLRIMAGAVVLMGTLATLFGLFIHVDQVIQAEGILETHNRLFEIRSRHEGQLSHVFVEAGAAVYAGMKLAKLDTQPIEHQLKLLHAEQAQLERNLWSHFYMLETLLTADQAQQILALLDPIADPLTSTANRWQFRRQIQTQLQTLRAELQTLEARLRAQKIQISGAQVAVEMARQEVSRYQALVEQQLESPAQLAIGAQALLHHQRELQQLQAQLPIQLAQRRQLQAQLKEQKQSFWLTHNQQFHAIQANLERNLLAQQQHQIELAQHQITAPKNGTIDTVMWHGAGEVIQPGQALAIVRPEFQVADLWVALDVAAVDMVWLHPGLPFRATVKGRSGEDHGVIHGTLGFMSSVTTAAESDPRRYRVNGNIERFEFSSRRPNPDRLLRPGLPLEVTIQAGERRLMHYLLDPFRQTLRLAWREPS